MEYNGLGSGILFYYHTPPYSVSGNGGNPVICCLDQSFAVPVESLPLSRGEIYISVEKCVYREQCYTGRWPRKNHSIALHPLHITHTHILKVIRAHYCTLCFSVSHTKEPFSPLLPYQKRAANHSLNVQFNTCFHLNGIEAHQTIKYLTRKCMKWKRLNIMC